MRDDLTRRQMEESDQLERHAANSPEPRRRVSPIQSAGGQGLRVFRGSETTSSSRGRRNGSIDRQEERRGLVSYSSSPSPNTSSSSGVRMTTRKSGERGATLNTVGSGRVDQVMGSQRTELDEPMRSRTPSLTPSVHLPGAVLRGPLEGAPWKVKPLTGLIEVSAPYVPDTNRQMAQAEVMDHGRNALRAQGVEPTRSTGGPGRVNQEVASQRSESDDSMRSRTPSLTPTVHLPGVVEVIPQPCSLKGTVQMASLR